MQFIDTTPWRLTQVAVGWVAGLGTVASYLTMGQLTTGFAAIPATILALTGAAWLTFLLATGRVWQQRRANITFLAHESAAPVLRRRREVERIAVRVRGVMLAVFVLGALTFLLLLGFVQCGPNEDCTADPAVPESAVVAVQYVALALGAAFGAAASFARIYTGETDDIELKALRNERYDDGTPGLSTGKWE